MKTILVVEDPSIMRHKTVTILRMEGFEVFEAASGAEAIRLAHEELPDLILCDSRMPDRDGREILEAVRANRATDDTPFIFLTARGERSELRDGMSPGADGCLVKPVPRTELIEAVHARLDRQRLTDERLREE